MKLRLLALSMFAFSAALLAGQETKLIADANVPAHKEFTARNFLCDPEVMASLNRIHKRTFMDKAERVVVVDRYQVRTTPDDNQHLNATVSVTPDSVALIHTHPTDGGSRPSDRDKDVARRIHVPVYVLTLNGLYAAMPDGQTVAFVAKYDGRRLSVCGR